MARTEKRLGVATSLGTTYTNLFTAAATTNTLLNVTNRTSSVASLRAYIATSSWSTGEPTGSTLVASIAYDYQLAPGEVAQFSGNVLASGEKCIVRSDTASSLDVIASGVEIA